VLTYIVGEFAVLSRSLCQGLGVEMDDALEFWRKSFSKKIPTDKFVKNYAYNIRHMYGKEGKRTSYTPYGCSYLINHGPSGPNEHHGTSSTDYTTHCAVISLDCLFSSLLPAS
jgi:DNA primase large subunit